LTALLLQNLMILAAAMGLTAVSLWAGGRLAPWFLKEAMSAPSLGSLFLSDDDSEDFTRIRMAACGLGLAVMLAGLLMIAVGARAAGWSPAF
jgi:hypothetical protein